MSSASHPYRTVMRGIGGYLPQRVLSNFDLEKMVDTSDAWIRRRTGIVKRHIAADRESTSDLAVSAARIALDQAGLTPDDIDLVIVATTTPDRTFPATATLVQKKLGMTSGVAFDIQAVCAGFIFALDTTDALLSSGRYRRALVIGAEVFSRILDWSDRTTCVLFGDGAGAMVVESMPNDAQHSGGILGSLLRSDGRLADLLHVDGGPSTTGTVGQVRMDGPSVYKHAIAKLCHSIETTLDRCGLTIADIDWFAPHQANRRINDAVAKRLGLDDDKLICTVADHGNTSAASIPLALSVVSEQGRLQPGQTVLMDAIGGGLSWGVVIMRL